MTDKELCDTVLTVGLRIMLFIRQDSAAPWSTNPDAPHVVESCIGPIRLHITEEIGHAPEYGLDTTARIVNLRGADWHLAFTSIGGTFRMSEPKTEDREKLISDLTLLKVQFS